MVSAIEGVYLITVRVAEHIGVIAVSLPVAVWL